MKLLKSCILLSLSGLLLMGNLTSCKKEEKTVIPDQDGWYASWSEAAMATVGEEAPEEASVEESPDTNEVKVEEEI